MHVAHQHHGVSALRLNYLMTWSFGCWDMLSVLQSLVNSKNFWNFKIIELNKNILNSTNLANGVPTDSHTFLK
jgi:hypothetical protein